MKKILYLKKKKLEEIPKDIKVENDTKKCKKIIFLIETGDEIHFIISGKIKQSKNIKSKETIKFFYKLRSTLH